MEVGVVRVAEDKDYSNLKSLIDNHSGWKLDYNKNLIKVWTKNMPDSSFKMVKVIAVFPEIPGEVIYDVLHDPDYRRLWDQHMIESKDIGFLNPNNDVGYYSMSCPSPLANRDFVLQRSWLDLGEEKYILNHSVYHKDYPPRKGFIRATSHLTGFFIKINEEGGCTLGYISQTDPQGTLPPWLVNKVTQIFGPKMVKNLQKATHGYLSWKNTNNPYLKPWIYPEQIKSPRLNLSDFDTSSHQNEILLELKNEKELIANTLSPNSELNVGSLTLSQLSLAPSDTSLDGREGETDRQHSPVPPKKPARANKLHLKSEEAGSKENDSPQRKLSDSDKTETANHTKISNSDKKDTGTKHKVSNGQKKEKKNRDKSSEKMDSVNNCKTNMTPPNTPKEKKKLSPYSKLKNSIRKKTGLSPK